MGTDFGHKRNEFSPRIIRQNIYSFCSFDTDYVYECDGLIKEGNNGEILINEPNKYLYHGPRKNAKTGYINDWMHISGNEIEKLLKTYPLPLNKPFKIKGFNAKKYFKKIELEYLNQDVGSKEIIKSIITQFVIKLYREYTKTSNISSNENENNQICKIHYEICQNPQLKWSLTELANKSGYSVSRFCEIYKGMYGEAPMQTVNKCRINMAKRLLSSGQVSVGTVAIMCGYNNIYYFSKYFKEQTGYTPTYYIENEI